MSFVPTQSVHVQMSNFIAPLSMAAVIYIHNPETAILEVYRLIIQD